MKLDEWKKQGLNFDYRGQSIFYRDEGTGDALLLIHGFPTASWDWGRVWSTLAARYRVIAPDMIGFGFSAKPSDYDYSILDQANLHEDLMRNLGIHRVHVLAHDYGDTVAQELLARYQDRQGSSEAGLQILSCCFLNGGLFPEVHRALLPQKLLNTPLGGLFSRLSNERTFRSGFVQVFGRNTRPSDEELHDFWQLVSNNGGSRIMHKLIRYIGERRHWRARWVGALQASDVPLRFINGALDPVSGRHMAERYRQAVPNPDVVLLDDVGHYPQVEDHQAVLDAYLEFRDRLARPGISALHT